MDLSGRFIQMDGLFVGSVQMRYDKNVWNAEMGLPLPWDRQDTELWTELVAPDRVAGESRSESRRILAAGQGRMPSMQKPTGKEPSKQIGWEYSALENVFGPPAVLGMHVQLAQKPILVQLVPEVGRLRRTGQAGLADLVMDPPLRGPKGSHTGVPGTPA